jgi:hypothetical protein
MSQRVQIWNPEGRDWCVYEDFLEFELYDLKVQTHKPTLLWKVIYF